MHSCIVEVWKALWLKVFQIFCVHFCPIKGAVLSYSRCHLVRTKVASCLSGANQSYQKCRSVLKVSSSPTKSGTLTYRWHSVLAKVSFCPIGAVQSYQRCHSVLKVTICPIKMCCFVVKVTICPTKSDILS